MRQMTHSGFDCMFLQTYIIFMSESLNYKIT
jgi:hypothetical protein